MTKVALYARVSTKEQETDNQIIRLQEYARVRGFEVVDVYEDTASGANPNRPDLDRLLADARMRRFDLVLATKLDRLMRSMINMQNVLEQLEKYGVKLQMLDQPIDTAGASGKLMLNILSAFAQFERELIADRTRDGMRRARDYGTKSGKPIGRQKLTLSPYQREKLEGILAADPDISMRKLATHFTGIGRTRLTEILIEEGYR